jgi:hypothetical protein
MSHKSQQTPSVGRVVHVVTFDGHHRPADILDPQDGITICVLAKVKPTDMFTEHRPHNAVLWFLDNCPHDPTAQQPGSWHWPEFVPPAGVVMPDLRWFNWSAPGIPIRRGKRGIIGYVWLWNLFNRVSTDGHFWGVGVLQIQNRHLFFIGDQGISILFIGRTS